jgi:hypothetical protein
MTGQFQDAGGQVAECGHGAGCVAGPDVGGVFSEGDVSEVVEHFDAPVAADPAGDFGGGGLVGGEARDGVVAGDASLAAPASALILFALCPQCYMISDWRPASLAVVLLNVAPASRFLLGSPTASVRARRS